MSDPGFTVRTGGSGGCHSLGLWFEPEVVRGDVTPWVYGSKQVVVVGFVSSWSDVAVGHQPSDTTFKVLSIGVSYGPLRLLLRLRRF